MKTKSQTVNGILASVLEILVGVLLLVDPIGFTSGILTVFGIILCLAGLRSVFTYFRRSPEESAMRSDLTYGLACLLLGCFFALKSELIITVFPILTVLYGIVILLTGLAKLQTTVDLLRLKRGRWYLAAINAVISLVCAAVILGNPFSSTAALWMFTGITLIAEAVLDVVVTIFSRPAREEAEEPDIVEEAE